MRASATSRLGHEGRGLSAVDLHLPVPGVITVGRAVLVRRRPCHLHATGGTGIVTRLAEVDHASLFDDSEVAHARMGSRPKPAGAYPLVKRHFES